MKQIRRGVFETNSSSTHSMTMCMKSDYDTWKTEDLYLNTGGTWGSYSEAKNKKFVTKEEVIDILTNSKYPIEGDITALSNEEMEELFHECGFYTYDSYSDNEYLEWFEEDFTTPDGETVVAFGLFGTNY